MTLAEQIAEKYFPVVKDRLSGRDRNNIPRLLASQAIQEFAKAAAEKIRAAHISPDDDYRVWFNTGLTDAAQILERESGE